MPKKPSPKEAIEAFAVVVRRALVQGKDVVVPNLGTFHVEHQSSRREQQPDGTVVMQPPRNVVRFEPA